MYKYKVLRQWHEFVHSNSANLKIMIMKKNALILLLGIAVVIILSRTLLDLHKSANASVNISKTMTMGEHKLHTGMRKLWEDHVTWTRNVTFCIINDLPGTDEAVMRLLKNQDDIGYAIKPYYGDEAGNKLAKLLHEHITIAADVLTAVKNDDDNSLNMANKKWKSNADEIATFLAKANPYWKLEDLKKMMQEHLKLTADEAMARKRKDYDGDVVAYDKVHNEILEMSDMLSEGIIKQFPDKVKEMEEEKPHVKK